MNFIQTLFSTAVLVVIAVGGATRDAVAQCDLEWLRGQPVPGPLGRVFALADLPGGALMAAGQFAYADSGRVDNLAIWDGSQWDAFPGGGTDGPIHACATLANGDIVVAGSFQNIGGVAAANIARHDGSQWHPLGAGTDGSTTELLVRPGGDLIASGYFDHAGGIPASRVARWDGSAWHPLGTGVAVTSIFDNVSALANLPNGDLVAGGMFFAIGGVPAWFVARWDGVGWSTVVPSNHFGTAMFVEAIAPLANGELMIAHDNGLLRWTGAALLPISIGGPVWTLTRDRNGDLAAGGQFLQVGGVPARNVARWDGVAWHAYGAGRTDPVHCVLPRAGSAIVTGGGRSGVYPLARSTAEWSPALGSWTDLGAPPPAVDHLAIRAMARLANGDVVVGGSFTTFAGVPANGIARWDGAAWSAIGAVAGSVTCVAAAPDGGVVVGGSLNLSGVPPIVHLARWDGSAWSAIAAGLPSLPRHVAVGAAGEVYAAYPTTPASTAVSMWTSGSPVTLGTVTGTVLSMVAHGNELFLGGSFGGVPVRRWNGAWSPVGTLSGLARSLVSARDGSLLASGPLSLGGVCRWDGSTWRALPGLGAAGPMTELANGELVVEAQQGTSMLRRWNGSSWQSMGDGINALVQLAGSGHGDLFVSGQFAVVAGLVSAYFAHARTTCPAAAIEYGSGCVGTNGSIRLVARHQPWLGAAYVGDVFGVPANALVVHALGVQALPAALTLSPGCSLFVDPLALSVLLPNGGAATVQLDVPYVPALVGFLFTSQAAVLELDALGALTRITSSPALALRVGDL